MARSIRARILYKSDSKTLRSNLDIFLKILTKMKNNTAPGIDLIVAYWWKKLFVSTDH